MEIPNRSARYGVPGTLGERVERQPVERPVGDDDQPVDL